MRKFNLIILLGLAYFGIAQDLYYSKECLLWEEDKPELKEGDSLLYSFYMIGDAGGDTTFSKPVLHSLEQQLIKENPEKSGVIFLGDNIYSEGLHKKSHELRAQDEARIDAQLEIVKDYDGEIVFIPGNHDWDRQGENGYHNVKRQEKYIQKYLDKGNVFRPSKGCPGPEVVKLAPGLVLIILDTQWWLHEFDKPSGEKDGCDVRNTDELLTQFKDLLKKYRSQNIIVSGHHPIYSNGHHGGHFTLKDHIFPLTAKNKNAYVPLPIIGSVYPLYRKFIGHPQDISHPVHQDMSNKLAAAMNQFENVVYVCGHEHNLQYVKKENFEHILSGSGSKVTHLKKGGGIDFGAEERGYSKLQYYSNGEVWMEFMVTPEETKKEIVAYRKLLFTKKVIGLEAPVGVEKKSYAGKTAIVTSDSTYEASGLKRLFFGSLNRDLWTTPLEVPYLDIHFDKGGLTPIKQGGGQQTLSLRMQGGDGRQYSLRGIRKNSTFLVDKNLRGTIVQDVIYDGISASHPYASVAIPPLADAAGVYHTAPTLVYVPKDPILGDYLEEFGGKFCLFEIRPDGDMSDKANFGNSEKVINYLDVIEKLHEKYNHKVDKEYTLNARLFDMTIGDWDRHDDQWRWASFKEGDKTLYRPIPRDRDQAFFKFDGIINSIVNRKWGQRKLQPFRKDIRDISGQNFNARFFDRSFLSEANKEDWIKAATKLKASLTDEVIENAIRALPQEGFAITGEEIIETLKARRDKLEEFAERSYDVIAREVDVVGKLKDDYFEVTRMQGGAVSVSVYASDNGQKVESKRFYHRVFQKNETKEIRLYGLDGKDKYVITGDVKKSILVRVIGGPHKDVIQDESHVAGLRKYTKVYEIEGENEINVSKEARVKEEEEINAYDYNRTAFAYDHLAPLLAIGFNPNDGFLIGGGFKYTKQGFEKAPYKYTHSFTANYAFGSEGFNVFYSFDYIDVFGKVDFAGEAQIRNPLVFQFFGFGNESDVEIEDFNDFDVRMNDYHFNPSLKFASKSHASQLRLGLKTQYVTFDSEQGIELPSKDIGDEFFYGITSKYTYVNEDHHIHPSRGIKFLAEANWIQSASADLTSIVKLRSELALFFPLNLSRKQATLGIRSGVSTNLGDDFTFFQANFLSGFDNFRGVLRNRFAGRSSNYNNLDLRFSLLQVKNKVVPLDIGLLGHGDLARIWQNGESSDLWHYSYGGGVFINFLDSLLLNLTYSVSDTDEVFVFGTKFLF